MPIYLRSGAIAALAPEMQFTGQLPWSPVTLDVYPRAGETNETTLYEDDTLSQAYKQGQFRKTTISESADGASNAVRVVIGGSVGTFSNAPAQRAWIARLHRPANWATDLAPVDVKTNGQTAGPPVRLIRNETAMPLGAKNGSPDADAFEIAMPVGPASSSNLIEVNFAPTRSPWTSRDIGSVAFEGGAVCSNEVYLLRGGGAGISGSSDNFHFMYQPTTGDGQITARVLSQDATDPWAKAGVMLRETLDAGSRHASMFVTPSNGLSFQRRSTAAGASSDNGTLPGTVPCWVRLVRSGTNLTGFISNNATNWMSAGSVNLIGLGQTVYWGLAVSAHNNSTTSVAAVDNVSLHTPPSISSVPDQTTLQGLALPAIPFTVGSDMVAADALLVTAASAEPALLPSNNITLGGSGSNRFALLTPVAGATGACQVTLTVNDGELAANTAFNLTVNPPPLLSLSPNFAAGQVQLSWPAYAGAMRVWFTTNLSPPVVWSLATDTSPVTNGDHILATLPATNRTMFFLLSSKRP